MKVSTKNTKEVMRKDALRFRGCIHRDSWVNLIPCSSNFFSQNKNKRFPIPFLYYSHRLSIAKTILDKPNY